MPDIPETVEADTAIGKFKISSANLNNLLTVFTTISVVLLCWMVYAHAGDARETGKVVAQELKEANKEVATTLKDSHKELTKVLGDLAQSIREQNCLLSFPPEKRVENAELCKRLSR